MQNSQIDISHFSRFAALRPSLIGDSLSPDAARRTEAHSAWELIAFCDGRHTLAITWLRR